MVISGCSPSPAEARAEATRSRAHARAASSDLLGALAELGTFAAPPQGSWSGCDDLGGKVLYHVTAQLDPPAEAPGALVDAVHQRLDRTGVRLGRVPSAGTDPVTWEGRRQGLHVQVTGYAARPEVLVDLSGPCLDVGDVDLELLTELPSDVDLR